MSHVSSRLRQRVARRARFRYEYCRSPQRVTGQTFHADHVRPESKGGISHYMNLCLCCPRCNQVRGNRTEAMDPQTGRRTALFNPRRDRWEAHFKWSLNFSRVVGITPKGRATVQALKLNDRQRVTGRKLWLQLGLLP